MAAINSRRVLYGALGGGVIWNIWSILVYVAVLEKHYAVEQQAGHYLAQSRYPFFAGQWIVTLFLCAYVLAWLYAAARSTLGPGPGTAFKLALLVGFVAAFPMALGAAAWSSVSRIVPLWQMLEMWVGAILATLVAGWLYKD